MSPKTARRVLALAATVLALGGWPAAAASPSRNVPPSPDYTRACGSNPNAPTCISQTLAAINHARSLEHVKKAMMLPRNFAKLTLAEQTFVVSDLERVDRGLAPFAGLAANFNRAAQSAATADADPSPASWTQGTMHIRSYGGNWAGDLGPLAADYNWMYFDGYGSGNLACPQPAAPGCWGHRLNILNTYDKQPTLVSGTGTVKQSRWISISQLFTAGSGKPPAFTYTWAQALGQGADGHR